HRLLPSLHTSSSSFSLPAHHRYRPSFPTRRSSDLSSATRRSTIVPATAPISRAASPRCARCPSMKRPRCARAPWPARADSPGRRSEEHTSELQSHLNLVCRLLLEKKNYIRIDTDEL